MKSATKDRHLVLQDVAPQVRFSRLVEIWCRMLSCVDMADWIFAGAVLIYSNIYLMIVWSLVLRSEGAASLEVLSSYLSERGNVNLVS